MQERIYLTPTPVRIWHWLNALGIVTLCVTGAQIRFPEYVNFFGTYKAAIRLHHTAGIVVALSFILWLFYYGVVAKMLVKLYVPTGEDLKVGAIRQAIFYFFYYFTGTKENPHQESPTNKFNPMQKGAYVVIMMVLVPLIIVTGLVLLNLEPLRELLHVFGGVRVVAGIHFLVACALCAFLPTHFYLATLGHTPFAHFKPMWTGWEDHHDH
ncbi:MAG: cytochrome b/b6 domain-containing protein [Desulfuromonadaceae bacterium]|nr:cytochrome b/b6 domain-containing protein [Desulfuromonadaceae bacterium]